MLQTFLRGQQHSDHLALGDDRMTLLRHAMGDCKRAKLVDSEGAPSQCCRWSAASLLL